MILKKFNPKFKSLYDFIMTIFFKNRITFFKVKVDSIENEIESNNVQERKNLNGVDYIEPCLKIDGVKVDNILNPSISVKKYAFEAKHGIKLIENPDKMGYIYIKNGKKAEISREQVLDSNYF